ncbi:MAG TPA: endolytic transglycosylase MltG, partial [Ilumatobacteraceae bacterium]
MSRRVDTLLNPESPDDEWAGDPWDNAEFTEAAVVERTPRKRRVLKWFALGCAWLLVIAVLVGGGIGWWYMRQVNPSGDPQQTVTFVVSSTDTLQSVSTRLQDAKIITNARVFRFYVDHKGGLKLTPGDYDIHPRDHMGNIMRVLNTPPAATFKKVTFPEGFTLAQMGARVQRDLSPLTAADFAAATVSPLLHSSFQPAGTTSLEGLLFPDTYQVAGNESAAQVVLRMISLMERVGRQENIDQRAAQLGTQENLPLTSYQVLIVASMIEREAKFEVDRPKIARVIYNRLELGMPLGI